MYPLMTDAELHPLSTLRDTDGDVRPFQACRGPGSPLVCLKCGRHFWSTYPRQTETRRACRRKGVLIRPVAKLSLDDPDDDLEDDDLDDEDESDEDGDEEDADEEDGEDPETWQV